MDSRVNFKESFEKCCCIPPTDDAEQAGYHGFISDNYVYNTNDRATLLSNYLMNGECLCSHLSQQFKTNRSSFKPWIAFLHILCSGILALFGMALTSNILVFEKKSIEMDYVTWRSLPISLTTILPTSQDKCEPLYVLIYAHCLLWFLFLVLDHVARYLHQKTLRLRGHLRVFQRLNRLAAIPFQLVSFWTVMLAIFIAVYAQQDNADMEPYCDANLLISPKNGIATLLVLEFISVTISSLIYGNAIRKFSLEKPQSDVYGWEENYSNRWTSQAFQQNNNPSVSQCPNTENFPTHHHETKCLLDLLEYYTHANKELASKLGHASLKLRQLEEEKYPQPSEL